MIQEGFHSMAIGGCTFLGCMLLKDRGERKTRLEICVAIPQKPKGIVLGMKLEAKDDESLRAAGRQAAQALSIWSDQHFGKDVNIYITNMKKETK